jgi:hypothetical protein
MATQLSGEGGSWWQAREMVEAGAGVVAEVPRGEVVLAEAEMGLECGRTGPSAWRCSAEEEGGSLAWLLWPHGGQWLGSWSSTRGGGGALVDGSVGGGLTRGLRRGGSWNQFKFETCLNFKGVQTFCEKSHKFTKLRTPYHLHEYEFRLTHMY